MRMLNARYGIATLAIGGFAAGTALFGSGSATAAGLIEDSSPLLTSTCSFAQVDAAMHDVAPDAAAKFDAAPMQKAMLQVMLTQPVDLRQKVMQQLSSQQIVGNMLDIGEYKPDLGPTLRRVAEVCHKY
ncbi:hemophore-related protein [Nocardia transvalensis]|uniref:hemophore-related protein n=1 Tax=Nocardia transvalensis TaxID=37333 RepID=UPI001893287A|nr:hemophore-related protein [Nocardia transvalensis]MBF6328698.1 hemophore-related protein [Nocardia transvalensis]